MSATSDFYLERAAESARAAQEANLANVVDRCRRAEAAWLAMADRLLRVEETKAANALAKAAQETEPGIEPSVPWPVGPLRRTRPTED